MYLSSQIADVFLRSGAGPARMWRGSSMRLEELDQKQKDAQWYLILL